MKKPKYLKLWRRSRKDPTLRYAVRVNGHTIELTKAFGTIEFDEEFEAAKAKLLSGIPSKTEIAQPNKPRRNSMAHLYEEYIKLPEFMKLNPKPATAHSSKTRAAAGSSRLDESELISARSVAPPPHRTRRAPLRPERPQTAY